jgi:hypothetical protein
MVLPYFLLGMGGGGGLAVLSHSMPLRVMRSFRGLHVQGRSVFRRKQRAGTEEINYNWSHFFCFWNNRALFEMWTETASMLCNAVCIQAPCFSGSFRMTPMSWTSLFSCSNSLFQYHTSYGEATWKWYVIWAGRKQVCLHMKERNIFWHSY